MDNYFGLRQVRDVILCQSDNDEKFKKIKEICRKYEPNGVEMIEIPVKKILILHSKNPSKSKNNILKGKNILTSIIEELEHQGLIINSLQAYSPTGTYSLPLIFPTGNIFILFKQKLTKDKSHSIIEKFKGKLIKKYRKLPIFKFRVPKGEEYTSLKIAKAFEDKDQIICATPDFHCLLKKSSKDQGNQLITNQSECPHPYGPDIPMFQLSYVERAWEFGKGGIDVAVIDIGFFNHPEINFHLSYAYDGVDGDNDPMNPPDIDREGNEITHGSEMSSVIANQTTDHNGYPHGVAPLSKIIPFRKDYNPELNELEEFLDSWVENWIEIFIHIFYSNVRIVNFSMAIALEPVWIPNIWHGWLNWLTREVYDGKGVFISASSGNCPPGGSPIAFMARLPTTFAVGLANRDLDYAIGNIGYGLDISVPDGAWSLINPSGGPTSARLFGQGGTSVAAAIVSGTAALILAQGDYSSIQIAEIIRRTARRSRKYEITADEDGHCPKYGYGFLDAFAAVKQAHKGIVPAGQVIPIRFDDGSPLYTLIQQLGRNPWFWCLVPRTDNEGTYWGHWKPEQVSGVDISAGANQPGRGLIIADFNGDGRDEIAVQQAGSRSRHFNIIYYDSTQKQWYQMGPSQESTFIWDPITSPIDQVFAADIDGDGVAELIASRRNCIDMAKFNITQNKWERFGPPMYSPEPINYQQIERDNLQILKTKVLDIMLNRIHRNDLNCDLILVTAIIRIELGIKKRLGWSPNNEIVKRVEIHSCCSLQKYSGAKWEPQKIDNWGTTHIPIPFTHKIIIADIDGDGTDEVIYIYNGSEKRLIVLDFAEPFPTSESQHGYIVIYSEWQWDGEPEEIVSGDFDGDGKDELAYLDSNDQEDLVHFLKWNPQQRQWYRWQTFSRKKLGNAAISLVGGDFDDDGKTEIGLLLEKPFANTYHVYKYIRRKYIDTQIIGKKIIDTQFQWVGDL